MGSINSKRKDFSPSGEVNFDHFQVLRAIGKGSFGKVCIVQKRSTDRLFAMKYMNKAQCEAKEAVGNVFREIEILASVEHPFLVNLWFSFQDEEDMFMVVDLLLGGDLRYHLQQGISFSDEAVRLYILETASAVDYLHTKNIIHRDIKPDNLLLDNEGHVHLTDFNIATVLKESHLATSMSGTKPYMAPEVFECALDRCEGYGYPVDWWSLGVTAYEVRRGKRPYDIHSNSLLTEVVLMFLSPPKFPPEWSLGLTHIISKLLTVSPASRASSFESLQRIPFAAEISLDQVLKKEIKPLFTPPKDHLNCDPTFELEEMIIESKPLHKKKKRLLKQKSIRENQLTPVKNHQTGNPALYDKMLIFNREIEEMRKEREQREKEWQEELDRSMSQSDPTGHGSGFTGSKTSVKRKKSLKLSNKSEAVEGVLTSLIAASAVSFSASIGPIDDINKQLVSKTKSKVRIEEKISKNSGFKQNGDAISKEVCCEDQFKSNNSLKAINEINFKTLSIEEEEKNDEELKGQDEDIMAVKCSESKSLDYLARTAAINLGNPLHPTSKIDNEKKSAGQISMTPKSTQSSKSLDDILFSDERIKSSCNVKGQSNCREKRHKDFKDFNKSNSYDSCIKNRETLISISQLRNLKYGEVSSNFTTDVFNKDKIKISSSGIPCSTPASVLYFKYPPLSTVSSDKACKMSSPPSSAPYVMHTNKNFIPPKRSYSLNIQSKEKEKTSSITIENPLSNSEKLHEKVVASHTGDLQGDKMDSEPKSGSNILLASCTLNPLYMSSLEYVNSSSSNSSLNSPKANKITNKPENTLLRKDTLEATTDSEIISRKMKKKGKSYSDTLRRNTNKLDEATTIQGKESDSLDVTISHSIEALEKKGFPQNEKDSNPMDLCKKITPRHVKKTPSSASLNNYTFPKNKQKIYQRSTSSESSKKETPEYVL